MLSARRSLLQRCCVSHCSDLFICACVFVFVWTFGSMSLYLLQWWNASPPIFRGFVVTFQCVKGTRKRYSIPLLERLVSRVCMCTGIHISSNSDLILSMYLRTHTYTSSATNTPKPGNQLAKSKLPFDSVLPTLDSMWSKRDNKSE